MKRWMFPVVASMFVFAACSNEEDPIAEPQSQVGSMVFELSAVNQLSDGLASRVATTPIYSQATAQNVTAVTVYAFVQSGSDYVFTKSYVVSNWTDGSVPTNFVVPDNQKLLAGTYRFLAVGRDAVDNFTVTAPAANATSYSAMIATITAPGDESEIFAGSADETFSDEGGRISIEMTRQVAGVLGYFKNVPQEMNGSVVQYLRLKISNASTQVGLYSGVGSVPTGVSYNIIDVNLLGQTVADGVYVGNTVPNGVVKVANSQLDGAYYMPVGTVMLTLGLYDSAGAVLKEWSVQNEVSATTFNIVANNFYSLGVKKVAGSTDGGTPGTPGDDDAPIDLLLDQNIMISIDPAWTTVHSLGITGSNPI